MNTESRHWIPLEAIRPLLDAEGYLIVGLLGVSAWIGYRLFQRDLSEKRHASLRLRFAGFLTRYVFSVAFVSLYLLMEAERFLFEEPYAVFARRLPAYLALLALGSGAMAVIQLGKIAVYQFLFWRNMKSGVPRLIVNLFTMIFSILIWAWILNHVFGLRLAPILATSAVASIVLGLAMQDTLGNLFSGIALQIDPPFGIGDWIEVQSGTHTWVGQVHEITWRATVLTGFLDEAITIPHRVMGQSQISTYSPRGRPVRRGQGFRVPFDAPMDRVRELLLSAADELPSILQEPAPRVLISETTDSWILVKIFYSIEDFGMQYRIGDDMIALALRKFAAAGIPLAGQRIVVQQRDASK